MEDLFGNATIFGKGLSIVWVDNDNYKEVNIHSSERININIVEGEPVRRPWRFTNLDAK